MRRVRKSGKWKIAVALAVVIAVFCAVCAVSRYPLKDYGVIRQDAANYGLEPAFVCAVIHTESKFRENAVSAKGASGLMQITRPTADWIAEQIGLNNYSYDDIFDPTLNVRLGCWYLSWLLERYGGDENLALAAYNAGIGNVDKWLQSPAYSSDGNSLDIIPFQETRDFVRRVEASEKVYGVMTKLIGNFVR